MTPMTRPRRPLPARVYWVRRGLVLGVALGMVFGIAHLLGGTGSEPDGEAARVVGAAPGSDSPSSTALSTADARPEQDNGKPGKKKPKKTKTPLAEPSGACEDSDIVATPKVKGAAHAGSRVTFRVKLTTIESPACTWRVSSGSLAVKLVSGNDRIWSSQDCPASIPSTDVVVRQEHAAKVDLTWRGRRSDSSCTNTALWAQPGWYHVQAAAFGAEPTDVQFELKGAVQQTITATPKPEPKKKADRKSDEPSEKPSAD
ncbi:MAG: hypothetical protein ACXWDI_04435 [Nocardioides sp.]